MPRKKTTDGTATPRKKKRAEKMPEGTFAAKLRIGPINDAHMQSLALKLGKKVKKTTRNDMKAFLHEVAQHALTALSAAYPASTAPAPAQDDLLS